MEKVKSIITDAQLIKPSIGDLPQALVPRLVDSNSKIAQLALQICESIVSAIGPKAKTHIRTLFPGIVQGNVNFNTLYMPYYINYQCK